MAIKDVFAETRELKKGMRNLSVEEVKALSESIQMGDVLLLDIREIQELLELGSIPGAKHVPRGMLEFWADPKSPYYREYFAEEKPIITFCAGGGRSVYAVQALQDMGYRDVAHLEEGFGGWKKASEPIEDVASTSKWGKKR